MSFVRLKFPFHDNTLLEKICQSRHDNGIEHVDLQKETIADMKAVERDALDQGNPSHEICVVSMLITAVADGQSMINGQMKPIDVGTNLRGVGQHQSWQLKESEPTFFCL